MWTLWVSLSSVLCWPQLHKLECKSRLSTSEDVNQEKVTSQHCRVPFWLVPDLFGSCPDLWSPLSPSSHPSGCAAFLLEPVGSRPCPLLIHLTGTISHTCSGREAFVFCFTFLSWKFWMSQDLRFLAFSAEPEVTHVRELNKGFCIVACVFQSHFFR